MLTRRDFIGSVGATLAIAPAAGADAPSSGARKRLAVITNVWTYRSHAWHMAELFLHGYPIGGK